MVKAVNGETVALSLTAWPAEAPPTVGASLTEVDVTVVRALVVVAEPSFTAMVKVVVSVLFAATRLSDGLNSNRRMAACAVAASVDASV